MFQGNVRNNLWRHKSCSISSVMGLTGYVSQRLSSKVLSCWSCVESWHLSLLCKKLLGLRGCPCNPHNGCSNRDLMEVLYSPVSCSKSDLHIVIGLTPFCISSVGNHQNYVLTTHLQNLNWIHQWQWLILIRVTETNRRKQTCCRCREIPRHSSVTPGGGGSSGYWEVTTDPVGRLSHCRPVKK